MGGRLHPTASQRLPLIPGHHTWLKGGTLVFAPRTPSDTLPYSMPVQAQQRRAAGKSGRTAPLLRAAQLRRVGPLARPPLMSDATNLPQLEVSKQISV